MCVCVCECVCVEYNYRLIIITTVVYLTSNFSTEHSKIHTALKTIDANYTALGFFNDYKEVDCHAAILEILFMHTYLHLEQYCVLKLKRIEHNNVKA